MTLEEIVDAYGISKGKHLVCRREEKNASKTFKGIKRYRLELWDVDSHKILHIVERTVSAAEDRDNAVSVMEWEFVVKMFCYAFE